MFCFKVTMAPKSYETAATFPELPGFDCMVNPKFRLGAHGEVVAPSFFVKKP